MAFYLHDRGNMSKIAIAGYTDQTKNYVSALEHFTKDITVSLEADELKDCEALFLPGGGDINPAYWKEEINGSNKPNDFLDKKQYEITDYFIKAEKPVFGICRGMQLINVYFGGSLIQDIDSKNIHAGIEGLGADRVHEVEVLKSSFLSEMYGEKFWVNSYHHQALGRIGEGLEVLLKAEGNVVEAIAHEDKKIFGVQFHPERMSFLNLREDTIDGKHIFEYFMSLI